MMKTIKNDFNEKVYTFTTPSALSVTIVHRPGFKRSSAVYGTPFGALNLKQSLDGNVIEHKSGVAHFLEHKLFEDESKDILSQFAELGASGNAFTSYEQTMYYFGHNGDLEAPLRLLIQFVSKFSVSEESVEKEKGIIIEEIKMYDQMPDMRLLNETYVNLFHHYPFIYDIAGTEKSVTETTRADLLRAFEMNYSDHRMSLTIVTPMDPQKVAEIVLEETQSHHAVSENVMDLFDEEPHHVAFKEREIQGDVEVPKMTYSFKFPYNRNDKLKDEFLIRMLLEMNFSEMIPDYQVWLDEGIVSNSYGYDVDIRESFGVIYFVNEGHKHESFKEIIKYRMNHLKHDEAMFNQLKKRYYGEMIMSLSKTDELAITLGRAHFDGVSYFEYLEMIRDLSYDALANLVDVIVDSDDTFLRMVNSNN
ncbi:EF-P 5-aminopentanol modification-associated protein YfmH [Erysipelothrix rhusiopathiae]|uniref:Peptidase, M16 family n=2 Tax=Erysipelothrix rhusiopathiae TaxID=1648 RepID=E7FUV2_ERYRH|nr:pitrilysin family protein [Erysipelothrix rhusiopathiae]EFY09742.1 peptidase, M16 family [Erysipelothrix rhusiopathiae ATCC 19414]